MSSTFQAQCHCGHHKWEWTLESDKQSHILCHCDTCKVLSGAPYTLNQIVPKSALKITSGGEPGKYSYKGDSGSLQHITYLFHLLDLSVLTTKRRKLRRLLLLPEVHDAHLPPPASHGPGYYHCPHWNSRRCSQEVPCCC